MVDKSLKIIQSNLERSCAAHDLVYATYQTGKNVLVVYEPNKYLINGKSWLKDNRNDVVVVLILVKKLELRRVVAGNGNLLLNVDGVRLVFCYISLNLNIAEYSLHVDVIVWAAREGNAQCIVMGDINDKSPLWGAHRTDRNGEMWAGVVDAMDLKVHSDGRSQPLRGEPPSPTSM